MFKLVVLCLAIAYVNAGALLRGFNGGFGGGFGGLGGGFGGLRGGFGGYGAGLALAGGYATGGYATARAVPIGPITAAVQSRRTYEVLPLALPQEAPIPQLIEVDAPVQPVHFVFRSQSSPVFVQQVHTPGAGGYEATRSEDAPHHLVHENYKPIIQELREVIQPFRKVIQKIEPVQEEVHTIVAKGEPRYNLPLAAPVAAPYGAPLAAPILRAPLAAPVLRAPLAAPLLAGPGPY